MHPPPSPLTLRLPSLLSCPIAALPPYSLLPVLPPPSLPNALLSLFPFPASSPPASPLSTPSPLYLPFLLHLNLFLPLPPVLPSPFLPLPSPPFFFSFSFSFFSHGRLLGRSLFPFHGFPPCPVHLLFVLQPVFLPCSPSRTWCSPERPSPPPSCPGAAESGLPARAAVESSLLAGLFCFVFNGADSLAFH